MNYKHIFYPETKFGGYTNINGTLAFYARVNSLLKPSFVTLDLGCGRGVDSVDVSVSVINNLKTLQGKCKEVIGIDIDKTAENNPFIDRFCLIEKDFWPLQDNSIDLCMSDFVLEHVADPNLFFSEAKRVLKPGGYLCLRTINVMSYLGLFSKLIPNKLHAKVLEKIQPSRQEEDVFPTLYRCNTIKKIRQILNKYNFDHSVFGYEAEPSYLSFSYPSYLLGVLHQHFAPNQLKIAIFAFAQKKV